VVVPPVTEGGAWSGQGQGSGGEDGAGAAAARGSHEDDEPNSEHEGCAGWWKSGAG